jgi:hypothetical protein
VGFSIMMELTDRLLLSSGSDGTTLVLEKDRRPAERNAAAGGD